MSAENLSSLNLRLRFSRKRARLTQTQVAETVGMKQPSYSALESEGNKTGSTFLPHIAKVLQVDLDWLIHGGPIEEAKADPVESLEIDEAMYTIPVIQPMAYTDHSSTKIDTSKVLRYEQLNSGLLNRKKINQKHLKLIEMNNHSMHPFINKMDLVGFDPTQNQILDGEVYLVYFEGEFMVKRIFKEQNHRLVLSSYNPSYREKTISSDSENFVVVGRQCYRSG